MTRTRLLPAIVISVTLLLAGTQSARLHAENPAAAGPAVVRVTMAEMLRAEANLSPSAKAYLESAFVGLGGWQQWVAAGAEGDWTAAELERVWATLTNTLGALAEQGLDGRALLAGYRFGRYDGDYVHDRPYRLAAVNHGDQIITLADFAFGDETNFTLYHELGHVLDQRLDRRLSARFHELIGSDGLASGVENDQATAEGYWLRGQSRANRLEATADAFAVWMIVSQGGQAGPVFRDTPEAVNHARIALALEAALQQAAENAG